MPHARLIRAGRPPNGNSGPGMWSRNAIDQTELNGVNHRDFNNDQHSRYQVSFVAVELVQGFVRNILAHADAAPEVYGATC